MIGSNSTALRQHAYSVFTASRRERESESRAPESVRRLLIPEQPASGRIEPQRVVEAKRPLGGIAANESPGAVRASLLRAEPAKSRAASERARGPEPTHEEIRQRAYELFEARGGAPGDPVADWLRAERELRQERGHG